MSIPEACRVFEKDVGDWDVAIEVQTPAGANRNTGTASCRLLAGGLWLVTEFRAGGDFEGHGVYGYDPDQGCYVGTWVDSMRTFLAPMRGTWEAATKTMTFTAEASFGGRVMKWRETTTLLDADTQLFRNYLTGPDGVERLGLEVTWRRRR